MGVLLDQERDVHARLRQRQQRHGAIGGAQMLDVVVWRPPQQLVVHTLDPGDAVARLEQDEESPSTSLTPRNISSRRDGAHRSHVPNTCRTRAGNWSADRPACGPAAPAAPRRAGRAPPRTCARLRPRRPTVDRGERQPQRGQRRQDGGIAAAGQHDRFELLFGDHRREPRPQPGLGTRHGQQRHRATPSTTLANRKSTSSSIVVNSSSGLPG